MTTCPNSVVRVPLALEQGVTRFASFLHLPSAGVVEIMAHAGLDAVVLDLEHGAYGIGELPDLVRAADASGIAAVVRVAENNAAQICRALDLGPAAVLVPQIEESAAAARACEAARYAPRGIRGAFPYNRSAQYSALSPAEHARLANEHQRVILLLEGRRALEDLDAILRTDADVLFFGPVDLSHSLGVPGDIDHPLVLETVEKLVSAAQGAGKATGAFASSPQRARHWAELGVNLVAVSVDSAVILGAYRELIRSSRG